ncbi:MAG TPA: hypothetical protein VEP90_21780 [Methylomirabilota bacterium]|nr:hypothetical protein [Methylomirabilota bacterium]
MAAKKSTKSKTYRGPNYTTLAPTYPVAPTLAGTSTHHVIGGQPGKAGMTKKAAKKNNKGKMVA